MVAGLVAGLAIAAQVGAISLLLVETAIAGGSRVGLAAGMGVATADFCFAVVAALAGGAAGAALAGHETEIHFVAAAVLAVIALRGLVALGRAPAGGDARLGNLRRPARTHYFRLLSLTAVNPLTIASFAAVAASLSLHGLGPYSAFVIGVGLASGGWHVFLTLSAAQAGCWITPRVQRALGIAGRVAILAIALRLALSV